MLQWLRRKLSPWSPEHQRSVAKFPGQAELDPPSPADLAAMGMTVAFFTRDSIYETEKNRLVRSAERLQLPVDAQAIDTTGSWVRNAAMKPGVLVGMRRKHRGPMLYVDVDAVFHRNPGPAWARWIATSPRTTSPTAICSAARCTSTTRRRRPPCWMNGRRLAAPIPMNGTSSCSNASWPRMPRAPRYRQARLPVAYCWIFDKIDNAASAQVYIEHLQASRRASRSRACSASPAATCDAAATGSGR